MTASTMSWISEISPIGDWLFKSSLKSLACIGVSTSPGGTALKRMPSFAYSIARLRVMIASRPQARKQARKAQQPAQQPEWAQHLVAQTNALVDCYAAVMKHAAQHDNIRGD